MNSPKHHEIPGHLAVVPGQGGLTRLLVDTPWSTAEIYLHGAHVTGFRKTGERPILFMSEASEFVPGKPIRGGVPVIFPWFGPREGFPAHGFARTAEWHLTRASRTEGGAVTLVLNLPNPAGFRLEYHVTVAEALTLELIVTNLEDQPADFEACLHTYFSVSAIDSISLTGLEGATYHDKVADIDAVETASSLHIAGEVDRVYTDTTATVEIIDPGFQRTIRVAKSGSDSTVIWNPWIEKSQRMADFGDDEYLRMICVESGNVADNIITLESGASVALRVEISSLASED